MTDTFKAGLKMTLTLNNICRTELNSGDAHHKDGISCRVSRLSEIMPIQLFSCLGDLHEAYVQARHENKHWNTLCLVHMVNGYLVRDIR